MDKRHTGRDARPDRPIKNLSLRSRPAQPKRRPRETVDYSATGVPVRLDPPIAVGSDELLARLQGGQR